MDKITRIHLAKIPYEIGVDAQIELRRYFDEIRNELDADLADEIMVDIEVRVTEILSDRHVRQNGVITSKDVDAVKEQLGAPDQFNDSEAKGKHKKSNSKETKRLLRDTDGAYIGGVASGLGAYFAVDPIFIRLIFIILAFVSGLGIVLYLVLWLLLPAAKTSSDKLQMSGQPVTAATLQRYRTSIQKSLGNGPNMFQRGFIKLIKIAATTLSVFICLYLLVALGLVTGFTYVSPFRQLFVSYRTDYLLLGLLWVICLSLIALLITLVIRIWEHRSSRLKVSAITSIAILIITIAGTGMTGLLVFNHFSSKYGNGKSTAALAVNTITPKITPTKLAIKSGTDLSLNYVVTNQAIHATYQAYPGLRKPAVSITNSHGMLSVNATDLYLAAPNCLGSLCREIYLPIRVTVYGPAIHSITENNGASLTINNADFGKSISMEASNGSSIYINNSYATTMRISATAGGNVQANNTSAQQTSVLVDSSSQVFAPATNSLSATIMGNCSQTDMQVLYLTGYSNQSTMINGQPQTANALNQDACVSNGD